MAPLLYLVILLYQTVLSDAECTVTGCNTTFCEGNNCTECIYPYIHISSSICQQCYLPCQLCGETTCYKCNAHTCHDACQLANCPMSCPNGKNVGCPDCPDGFHKRSPTGSHCYRCLHTDCKCTSAGNCIDCLPGRYNTSSNCENTCPSTCITCTSINNCSKCVPGKYGPACASDCISQCQDDSCDKVSGNCTYECPVEQYWEESTKQCLSCRSRCNSCISFNQCTSCSKQHYWGSDCEKDCVGCSEACNKDTGCPAGCMAKYYKMKTNDIFECIRCPNSCKTCTSLTQCNICEPGYWGSACQYNCTGCSDECTKDNGCKTGCQAGYFQSVIIPNGFECTGCLEHCEICSTETDCQKCFDGYYPEKNKICISCSDTCKHNTCDQLNGSCLHGCIVGFWGTMCSEQCSNGCKDLLCNKTTGTCLDGCSATYYGQLCKDECNANCAKESVSSRYCSESNGSCEAGCKTGFHGMECSSECKNCKNLACFQKNGTCRLGCTDGFTGAYCNEETGSRESPLAGDNDSGSSIGVYAGASAGAVAVIVIIIVVVLLLRRRRAIKKNEPQDDRLSLESVSGNLGKGENTYATITDSKTKHEVEIIPEAVTVVPSEVSSSAQTQDLDMEDSNGAILSKDSRKESSEGLIEKDAISTDFPDIKEEPKNVQYSGKQNVKVEVPVEKIENQVKNVDDIPDKELEAQSTEGNADEEGNTYYNTVGKRVPVSDLADYVRNRDFNMLIEEFNKLPRGLLKDYNTAKHPRNVSKNRYKMIYPYDESRVVLKDGPNDYINASFIQGYNKPKEYIGSSGPFQRGTNDNGTVADLWRMVWQEKCETIVMLTKCFENKEHKCEQYWPELGQSKEYAKLNVSCVTEDQYADFTIRSFVVTKAEQTLNSRHLHFTAWPDKGVPADVTSMIEYRQKVRSLHKDAKSPMLVHCSAGIGRTGTFIALDMLTFMGEARGYVDMFGCVANLRFQRTNLIQTPEQYEYLHHAILHALTFDCKSIAGEKFIETYSRLIKKKDGTNQLETQFQSLQSTVDEISVEDKAAVDRNKTLVDKNREGADIPGDENRVRLFENRTSSASDYVNALYINGFRSRNKFIVAQSPLPTTVVDFLSLIFQVKCSCIVMMEETDLQDKTVGVYWPADNQVIKHGVFQVACKESKTTASYTVKTLSVKRKIGKKEEELDVNLFIYTKWPEDAAVPKSSDSLIQLVKDVDTTNHRQDDEKPILIHCMTGAMRSCLYCAVSVLIEKMEIEHEVSVVNTLRQIKARRRSSIPTLDQYKFCHQAVISYIQTFDIYSNFGLKSK